MGGFLMRAVLLAVLLGLAAFPGIAASPGFLEEGTVLGRPLGEGQGPPIGVPFRDTALQAAGAKCDGTTNDAAAINAALSSGARTVVGPDNAVCRAGATIVVPGGVTLRSNNTASMGNNAGVPGGFTIKCDLAVNPCVRLDGDNNQSALVNVGVDRAAGTIPAGTVGVQLYGGMYTVLENVGVYRNAISIQEYDRGSFYGLFAIFNRVLTCMATDTHLEINGWRETRINQSRFGCNGNYDVANNNYVRITGGHGDGPNTVHIVNSQFNQGSAALVDCFMHWQNLGGGTDGPTSGWNIESVHVEQASSAFCTDATVVHLNGLQVSNSKFFGGFTPDASFFRLNPGTNPSSMNLTGNQIIAWGDLTIAPSAQFSGMIWTGNEIITTGSGINLTGVGSSQALLYANRWQTMHLAGNWGGLGVYGTGGVNSNTATGFFIVEVPGYGVFPCTMQLVFSTSNTGVTYKTPAPICQWQRDRNAITVSFYVELTSKGTASGTATLSGLPYQASFAPGLGTSVLFVRDVAGVGGPVLGSTGAATKIINLYKTTDTGLLELDATNFTNTSVVQGLITYILDSSGSGLPPLGP